MNRELEAQTRKQRIDPRLKAAEWSIARFDADAPLSSYHRTAVKEYETKNGPADYALCDKGQVRGVVEAKKVTLLSFADLSDGLRNW
jgi:type I restriction enzyme R subunit